MICCEQEGQNRDVHIQNLLQTSQNFLLSIMEGKSDGVRFGSRFCIYYVLLICRLLSIVPLLMK